MCKTIEEIAKETFGGFVVEKCDNRVLIKKHEPLYEEAPYLVTHFKDGMCYWSSYDLTLKQGVQVLYKE